MKRIVVVDDQPMLVNLYRTKFAAEGFQVEVAADGEQALEVIKRVQPHLVLLDLMLPKIGGLEVLRRLRNESAFRSLPIIVFSASARPGIVEEAWSAGATIVLSKNSTRPKELVELIHKTLANHVVEAADDVTALPPATAANPSSEPHAKPRVVHFDPNPDLQALVGLLLRRAGYRVDAARSETEVIRAREGETFFLINGISGSCTKLVKQYATLFPQRPIVAYSTAASMGQQSEVLRAGAAKFIHTPEELLNIAETLSSLAARL